MEEKKTVKETEPEKLLMEELEKQTAELDDLKEQLRDKDEMLAKLANNCYALQQNLRQVETKYPSTMIMADCIRIADGSIEILQGK